MYSEVCNDGGLKFTPRKIVFKDNKILCPYCRKIITKLRSSGVHSVRGYENCPHCGKEIRYD